MVECVGVGGALCGVVHGDGSETLPFAGGLGLCRLGLAITLRGGSSVLPVLALAVASRFLPKKGRMVVKNPRQNCAFAAPFRRTFGWESRFRCGEGVVHLGGGEGWRLVPRRRTHVLAKGLVHGGEVLPLEHAARKVLHRRGDNSVQGHVRLQAVGNMLVYDFCSAVAVVCVAGFVRLCNDVVQLLLPVDRQLDGPQPEAL